MEAYHLYHRSAELSDIEIVYSVTNKADPPDTRAAKRRRQDDREAVTTRYPAHKLCLSACSGVMRTEIEAGATMIQVVLEDEAEVPAADAMVAVMYGVPDALQDAEQQVVLRMALLANKYDAPKVLSTAVQHLSRQPQLDAATMQLFWQLPGFWEQPFWPLVPQAVQHKLDSTDADRLQALTNLLLYVCDRDLEAVWADSSSFRRDLLLGLPVDALTAFLQSSELRVVSEDTVLYTVTQHSSRLLKLRPRPSSAEIGAQCEQLLTAVRLPQLSPSALLFIAPELPWFTQQQCRLAAFVRHVIANPSVTRFDMAVPDHWLLAPRGSSPKTSHVLEFSTSLAEVQTACAKVLAAPAGVTGSIYLGCSNSSSYAGRDWRCKLYIKRKDDGLVVGAFAGPRFPLLSSKAQRGVPWTAEGVQIELGSWRGCDRRAGAATGSLGWSDVVGVLRSADAWEAPDWAEGDRVVARVTVHAHNII